MAATPILFSTPDSAQPPNSDFRFERWETLGDVVTPLTRGVANLQAIKLLKTLEAEERTATRDEQVTLSRFTGYGASNVLAQGLPMTASRAVSWRNY